MSRSVFTRRGILAQALVPALAVALAAGGGLQALAAVDSNGKQSLITGFRDVVKATQPAVVSIVSSKTVQLSSGRMPSPEFFGPFGDLFGFGEPGERGPRAMPRERQERGLGSGVIVRPDGYIICRVVVADTRMYIVYMSSRELHEGSPRARRFFDSFQITDAALLAKAGDRKRRQDRRGNEELEEALADVADLIDDEIESVRGGALAAAGGLAVGELLSTTAEQMRASAPRVPDLPVAPPPRLKKGKPGP